MEPRDYLRLFRRRWWLVATIAFIGAAFAWMTAPANVAPKIQRFAAEHILIVEPESRSWTPENPETIALLAQSGEVPRRVAGRIWQTPDDTGRALRNVTITGDPDLAVVKFRAVTGSSMRSVEIANAFAEELVVFLDEEETTARTRQIESAKTQAQDLRTKIESVSNQLAAGDGDPAVLEQERLVLVSQYGDAEARYQSLLAEPPASSGLRSLGPAYAVEVEAGIHPPRGRFERAGILGMLGMLLGLAVVVVLERLDVRIKTKEEAEAAFRLPVIAEIPSLPMARRRQRQIIGYHEPASSVAEAYRGLRTTLLILKPSPITSAVAGVDSLRRRASDRFEDHPEAPKPTGAPQVFLVTSTRPSEGKTTSTANLAAAFAEAGRSVLVIGADIRRPEIHEYLQVPRSPGLTEALLGRGSGRLADMVVPTMIPGVHLLPSGGHVSNPGELLLQGPELINEARSLADVILVDTTPLLTVNDAIQLIPATDAVILTCRAGRDTAEGAKRAHEILARLRVPVAGVVLVGARETPGVSSYYYGYQSGTSASPLAKLRRSLRRGPTFDQDASDLVVADVIGPDGDGRSSAPPPRPVDAERVGNRRVATVDDDTRPTDEPANATEGRHTNGKRDNSPVIDPREPDPWGWP